MHYLLQASREVHRMATPYPLGKIICETCINNNETLNLLQTKTHLTQKGGYLAKPQTAIHGHHAKVVQTKTFGVVA